MNVLILEDEHLARERLKAMITSVRKDINIVAEADSVQSVVEWLSNNPHPDLAFFDIQLGDGISFEVFEQLQIRFPVIFTTAFDEYSIRAFKVNSVDYLLKPYTQADLEQALEKYQQVYQGATQAVDTDLIRKLLQRNQEVSYRKRMMIRIGDKLTSVSMQDASYFYSMHKATYVHMKNGKEYLLDESLDALEPQLNPEVFFRINRQYITHVDAVKDIVAWTNSRLKINLKDCADDDIFVSRNKAGVFKSWLNQ